MAGYRSNFTFVLISDFQVLKTKLLTYSGSRLRKHTQNAVHVAVLDERCRVTGWFSLSSVCSHNDVMLQWTRSLCWRGLLHLFVFSWCDETVSAGTVAPNGPTVLPHHDTWMCCVRGITDRGNPKISEKNFTTNNFCTTNNTWNTLELISSLLDGKLAALRFGRSLTMNVTTYCLKFLSKDYFSSLKCSLMQFRDRARNWFLAAFFTMEGSETCRRKSARNSRYRPGIWWVSLQVLQSTETFKEQLWSEEIKITEIMKNWWWWWWFESLAETVVALAVLATV
jgi:hypothetical protein